MNVVREIERINKAELERGGQGGSWHDQYKDSAYVFIGGLPSELTEGDVITIFSQFGEPVDINLPRDKQTGKTRGFGFLMYENQKSTILAVDNLNGAKVLGRTLRVDHVSKYKHLEKDGETGKFKDAEQETMNARPELFMNANKDGSDDENSEGARQDDDDGLYDGIDPDDPMAAYLIQQRKEERALTIADGSYKPKKKSGSGSNSKHKGKGKRDRDGDMSKEERRIRREEKRRRREEREMGKPSSRRRRYSDDEEDEDNNRVGELRIRESKYSSRSRSRSPLPRRTSYSSEDDKHRRRPGRRHDGILDERDRSRSRERREYMAGGRRQDEMDRQGFVSRDDRGPGRRPYASRDRSRSRSRSPYRERRAYDGDERARLRSPDDRRR